MSKPTLVFDMDGVLVDVTESYRETIARTVEHFTGTPVARERIQELQEPGRLERRLEALRTTWSTEAGVDVPFDVREGALSRSSSSAALMAMRERWIARPARWSGWPNTSNSRSSPAVRARKPTSRCNRFAPALRFDPMIGDGRRRRNHKPAPDGLLRIEGAAESRSLLRRRHRGRRAQRAGRRSSVHRDRRAVQSALHRPGLPVSGGGRRTPSWTTSIISKRSLHVMRSATVAARHQRDADLRHAEDRGPGPIRRLHRHPLLRPHAGAVHQARRLRPHAARRRRSRRRPAPYRRRRRHRARAAVLPRRSATARASTAPGTSSCRWTRRSPWSRSIWAAGRRWSTRICVKVRLVGDLQTELVDDFFDGFVQSRGSQPARQSAVRPLESPQDRSDLQVLRARDEVRLLHGRAAEGPAAVHQGTAYDRDLRLRRRQPPLGPEHARRDRLRVRAGPRRRRAASARRRSCSPASAISAR